MFFPLQKTITVEKDCCSLLQLELLDLLDFTENNQHCCFLVHFIILFVQRECKLKIQQIKYRLT